MSARVLQFILVLCCTAGFLLRAEGIPLKSAPIFRDHMVLQCESAVPVWGTSAPGISVTVEFAGQIKTVASGTDGKWMARLDPMPASPEPRELVLRTGGKDCIKINDVLVGEVWICSGQSNMEWIMGRLETPPGVRPEFHFPGVEHGEEEAAKPERADLRIFSDDLLPYWEQRGWQRCGGEALRRFSGTAFFFGDFIQREMRVPVGLINVSRGGSPIHEWTPREFAERNAFTIRCHALFLKHRAEIDAYSKATQEARRSGAPPPAQLSPELDLARRFHSMGTLFERLVEPLVPFACRGVIWYQGEASGSLPETAAQYRPMLRDLIEGWRDRWEDPAMPWYIVQLPCWEHPETLNWPPIRQAQWETAETMPNVGMATICDVADFKDLHPGQKKETGERLARLALARTYGNPIPSTGPRLKSVQLNGNSLLATFESDDVREGPWMDVELAGADGLFHPVEAEVKAGRAVIACDTVPAPRALRYGWKAVFTPSLFSRTSGLPAAPFAVVISEDGRVRPGLGP